jgi:hypothetical protein
MAVPDVRFSSARFPRFVNTSGQSSGGRGSSAETLRLRPLLVGGGGNKTATRKQ